MECPLTKRTACARSIGTVVSEEVIGHDIAQPQGDGDSERYHVCGHVKGLVIIVASLSLHLVSLLTLLQLLE